MQMAGWVHLPALRSTESIRNRLSSVVAMCGVPTPDLGHGRDDPASNQEDLDRVVLDGLLDDDRQARPVSAAPCSGNSDWEATSQRLKASRLHTTCWGMLSQPDKQELAKLAVVPAVFGSDDLDKAIIWNFSFT